MDEDGTNEEPQPQPQPQPPLLLRKSCDYCAKMKRACDGGSPCSLCCRRGKTCERRLRRKSGPAKGTKYAPRRRKLDDEVALTEKEEAAAAAAVTVAATRGVRRCSSTTGGGGGSAKEVLRPARSHGLSSSERGPMRESSMKQEQEEKGAPPEASTTQPRHGLGGGRGQRWAEGAKRDWRCSTSSSGSGSAAPHCSASSHGLPPQTREFSSLGGVEAVHVAASGGGERERVFVTPNSDRGRHSCSSVEDRLGGGGDDHPDGASGRSSSSSSSRRTSDGVAPPSSPPSLPPLPSSGCTSYSSRGTVGRLVSATPLKGAGVGGEAPVSGKARAEGRAASRVQAIEPSVRGSGADFHFLPHRDGAAAQRPPPHRGGGGSVSQQSPGEQQPLAPRDLLLMLRPDDERVIDIIADTDEDRSSVPTAFTAVGSGGGSGGGADAGRRRSWSNDSRTCAEAGELLRGIRRDSASAVAAAAAAAAAATTAGRQGRPDESGSNKEDTAVARSPAPHSGRRGGGDDPPAPAGPPPGDWPLDSVEGCPWRGDGGRPLLAGRRRSGAGFAFGEHVHHRAGGWPTQATAGDNLYVGSAKYGHGHGNCYASGYGSALVHQPPHGDGDGRRAPMWHYDSNHVLEYYPLPVHAGGTQRHHHYHRHHISAAAHPHPPSRFSPHHFPRHSLAAAGVLACDSGGGAREDGSVGIRTRALLFAGEWTAARPNPAATSFPKAIPADAPLLPPPAGAGAGTGAHSRRRSGDDGGGEEAGVSARGYWSGGNWSARPAQAAAAAAPTDARFSRGDAEGGDDAVWRVRSDGPFRKRGKVARA